ncbi:MAG: type II toxin-antitoxin system VapC family toxin [Thermoleophilaceae bacterium]
MPTLVLDASVVVALIARVEPRVPTSGFDGANLVAPAHLDAEALSALFGLARAGAMDSRRLVQAVADLSAAPIRRLPLGPLLSNALSLRHNVSAYDALYVAAARAMDCALLTRDRRLAGAPGLDVPVTLV